MAKKINSDSKLWKIIGIAGNAIWMNLTFLLCCIPIVTIGPAVGGLYSAIRFFIRGDSWLDGFKEGFKNNVWRILAIWTVGLAAALYVGNELSIGIVNYEKAYLPMVIMTGVALFFILAFVSTLLCYNVYFPGKFIDILTETAAFIFSNLPKVVFSTAVMWFPVIFFFAMPGAFFEFLLVFLGLYFSVATFASTVILKEPLIKVLKQKNGAENNTKEE